MRIKCECILHLSNSLFTGVFPMPFFLSRSCLRACLLAGASIPILAASAQAQAQNQARPQNRDAIGFHISAGPLSRTLRQFAEQSGVQVGYAQGVDRNLPTAEVNGKMSAQQALSRILSGTGLTFRFASARAVIVERGPAAAQAQAPTGAVQLGTLRVEGVGDAAAAQQGDSGASEYLDAATGDGRSDADQKASTYRGAGTSAYVSREDIQRLRGSSTGDFLSGIPGVTNAENRNSGALDVNIRGLQGQGRVPVVIDGAMQESTVYRGYAGMAGRTYIDPDMIGGVSVEKGPSAGADATGAVGGILRARTLNAGDIVAPDGHWGVVLRGGLSDNNSKPPRRATVGGSEPAVRNFDRPGLFDFRGRSGSIAAAYRDDVFDLVAAYATRKSGNYFSGSKGKDIDDWGGGANRFDYEEQVINTSQENESYLLRAVIRPSPAHTLDLSYMRYDTLFGEMKPSQLMYGDTPYQTTSDVTADTYTARYRFKPEGSLIDLRADLWATNVDSFVVDPVRLDLGGGYIYNIDKFSATRSKRWGITVSNTSRFSGKAGDLSLAYGLAYDHESFGKSPEWDKLNTKYPDAVWEVREGWRRRYSGFVSAEYKPAPWAVLNASIRYLNNIVQDKNPGTSWVQDGIVNRDEAKGWAPIFSALIEPVAGLQFFTRYAEALRAASPFEATEGFSGAVNPYVDLRPEHSYNTEAGVNYQKSGIINSGDLLQLKASWFRNHVEDYITLGSETLTTPNGLSTDMLVRTNIPSVTMTGVELSARYDTGSVFVELAGTDYTSVRSCYRDAPTLAISCHDGMPATSNSWFVDHIPPKRALYATLGARLFDETLSLGARYSHIERDPDYDLLDLFGSYQVTSAISLGLSVDNLFDRYYVDALSLGRGVAVLPSPGRTVRLSLSGRLGDGSWRKVFSRDDRVRAAALGYSGKALGPFDGNWSGLHIGASWGWTSFNAKGKTKALDGSNSPVARSEATDFSANSITGGLNVGYDFQTDGGFVYGLEIGFDTTRARKRQNFVTPELDEDRWGRDNVLQADYRHRFGHGGSARMRLGKAAGRALFYGSGGIAVVEEQQTRTQFRSASANAAEPFGFVTRPYFSESAEKTRLGFMVGGGTELAFSNHLSLRGEYMFSHFPGADFRFDRASRNIDRGYTSQGIAVPGGADVPIGRSARNTLESHSLRLGINYRF